MPLTDADVRRLLAGGLRPEAFTAWLGPEHIDVTGEPESLVRLPGGPRLLVLAHENDACVFLGPNGCRIHALRPSSCRAYPFDRPSVADHRAGRRLGLHPDHACPSSTGWRATETGEDHEDEAGFVRAVARRDDEAHAYAERVQQFNRKQKLRRRLGRPQRTASQFLAWVMDQT